MRTQSSKLIWMVNISSFCLQVYKKWIKENSCSIFDPVSQPNERQSSKRLSSAVRRVRPHDLPGISSWSEYLMGGSQDDCWNRGFRVSIQTCPANSLKIMERGLYKNLGSWNKSLFRSFGLITTVVLPIPFSFPSRPLFLTASLYILPPSNCSKTTSFPIRRVRFLNLPTNKKSDYR